MHEQHLDAAPTSKAPELATQLSQLLYGQPQDFLRIFSNNGDSASVGPDLHLTITEHGVAVQAKPADTKVNTSAEPAVKAPEAHLPAIQLTDAAPAKPAAQGGVGAVLGDLAHGAWNEITQHPGTLLKDAAIGAAFGAAAVIAGPEIALAAGAVMAVTAIEARGGFVKTAEDLYHGTATIAKDAAIAYSPDTHNAADQAKAKTDLEQLGAGATDMAAGIAGGMAGGMVASAIRSSIESSSTTALVRTDLTKGEIVSGSGDGGNDSALSQGQITLRNFSYRSSGHADVTAGQLTSDDGTVTNVYFHAADANPEATAARITNEQAGYNLNRMVGFENAYPESQPVTLDMAGQTQTGWLQESSGSPLEYELQSRAYNLTGTVKNMDVDVAKVLADDPVLNNQVQQAVAERLMYGDTDVSAMNIGFSPNGDASAVSNFDLGRAFGSETTPSLTSMQDSLTSIGLKNAMSGQEFTPEVSQTLKNFLTMYDNEDGMAALRTTGLNDAQIDGVLGRTRWLTENGRFPEVDPALNSPENIAWYKAGIKDL